MGVKGCGEERGDDDKRSISKLLKEASERGY